VTFFLRDYMVIILSRKSHHPFAQTVSRDGKRSSDRCCSQFALSRIPRDLVQRVAVSIRFYSPFLGTVLEIVSFMLQTRVTHSTVTTRRIYDGKIENAVF